MYEYRVAQLLKVVDGDTIDVAIDLGFDISVTKRVRLAGIDTPESRTKDLEEKAMGLESKEYLKHALENAKDIIIKTEIENETGKFGRVLGWLYLDGQSNSINNIMVKEGYAWEYDGGTKHKDLDELRKNRS